MPPLNPSLHAALDRLVGPVRTTNPGLRTVVEYIPEVVPGAPLFANLGGELGCKARIVLPGETYWVACPFCDRDRWYSALWGLEDPTTGEDNTHLSGCMSPHCRPAAGAAERLARRLLDAAGSAAPVRPQTLTEPPPDRTPQPGAPVPSHSTSLSELPFGHPLDDFLRRFRFQPASLARRWDVRFFEDGVRDPVLARSLVVPVHRAAPPPHPFGPPGPAVPAGWVAFDPAVPRGGRGRLVPSACLDLRRTIYGLDRFGPPADGECLVLVPEPCDAWKAGRGAAALFSESITPEQVRLVLAHAPRRTVIVAFGGRSESAAESVAETLREGRRIVQELRDVVVARLPRGTAGPADCTVQVLRERIGDALAHSY